MDITNVTGRPDSSASPGNNDHLASAADSAATDSLANKEAFLQLLIAQIKNQDPLNPTNGLEFLTQLAQFSELEQLISIRTEIQALRQAAALQTDQPTDLSGESPDRVLI